MFTWHLLSWFLECFILNTERQELHFLYYSSMFNVKTFYGFWDVFFKIEEKKQVFFEEDSLQAIEM